MKITILAIIFLCILTAVPVNAQQISLSISPPLVEIVAKPGKSLLIAYTLDNGGDPVVVTSTAVPFQPSGTLGNISLKDEYEGPVQFSLENSDIQLNQPFFLRGNAKQQLLLRIRIPEGAPEADYYYTFLNTTEAPPAADGSSETRAKTSIGANIIITVTDTGQLETKGKITTFDVRTPHTFSFFNRKVNLFDSGTSIPVMLQVQNWGKNAVKSNGTISLRGNFGELATYSIVPQNILSESQRLLLATPSAELIRNPATLVIPGFFIGTYKLSAVVNFGEGSPNLYASSSFVALPLKFIIGILIASIVTVIIVKIKNRRDLS